MDYYILHIACHPDRREIINGFLSLHDEIEAFVETEEGLDAFVPVAKYTPELDTQLVHFVDNQHILFTKEIAPDKNWNEVWESNFDPVIIGNFCAIRADFHPPIPEVEYELLIQPKNAFGTGHHETTYMMIQMMESMTFGEQRVLDFGTGSGVLAILACKLGAKSCTAIDISESAIENTLENADKNQVSLKVVPGTLDVVGKNQFDIILANIHLNVLVENVNKLSKLLAPDGHLILSGILETQQSKLLDAFQIFQLRRQKSKGHWMAFEFVK